MKLTEEQYNVIESKLVKMAIETLNISEKAAKLRIKAIIKSGILEKFGEPTGMIFQIAIDSAMMIPQLGESE